MVVMVGNFGAYFGIPAGIFYDRYGPQLTLIVGVVIAAGGYLPLWAATAGQELIVTHAPPRPQPPSPLPFIFRLH